MIFRIAKNKDFKDLAKLHAKSGKTQEDGFLFKLGESFLRTYYKLLLNEPKSIIILAEDNFGKIHGFVSGTQSATEHLKSLNKNRLIIAIRTIPSIIFKPNLFKEILKRYRFSNGSGKDSYGVKEGARLEYWIWDEDSQSNLSPMLLKAWIEMMYILGVSEIHGEVDKKNKRSYAFHKIMGAEFYETTILSDKRERIFYKYKVLK